MNIMAKIRSSDAQSSAEIIDSIGDLLTLILLRLPIKSLIRFKLVSKHWHSLITNPRFCILRNPSPNPAVGLFLYHYDSFNARYEYVSFALNQSSNPPFRKLNFTKDPSGIGILQSCNGLLLCSSSSFDPQGYSTRFYVYNPTIKRFTKLPKLEEIPNQTIFNRMSLAFDPAKSPHYKAVCSRGFVVNPEDFKCQIEVYSSDSGPWRKRGEPFTCQSTSFEEVVYWNGAIHWINDIGDSQYFNPDDDEKPKMFALPPIPDGWEWRSNYYMGESCGHLHYIELLGQETKFKVYEMKSDYSEWFVKYNFDLSSVFATYPLADRDFYDPRDRLSHGFSVFSVVRGERDEDSFLVLQFPGRVLRYSLVCGTFGTIHELEDADEGFLRYPMTNGYQYIESLCCV